MSDQSRFRALFESALQDYKRETGTELVNHPLTQRFANCHSIESVIIILQEQVQLVSGFGGGRRGDGSRIEKSLKRIASALYTLSTSTALGRETIDLV
jgi:hypothetical protein